MSEPTTENTRRVLIIDDNIANPDEPRDSHTCESRTEGLAAAATSCFAEGLAKHVGVEVRLDFASEGEEGFKKIESSLVTNDPYAITFIDMHKSMHKSHAWDGVKTIEALLDIDPLLQVACCSADPDTTRMQIRQRLGGTDRLLVLKKPFEDVEVLRLTFALAEERRIARVANLKTKQLETLVSDQTREFSQAREDSDRLIAAIDSVLVGLDEKGQVVRWNANAEALFGISSEEAHGKLFGSLDIPWDDRAAVKHLSEERTNRLEAQFCDAHDTMRVVGLSSYPIYKEEHRTGMLLLGKELTEQRKLECQLQQSQKLESVGQLAAGVAHEINTPMQYIGDNLDFLEKKMEQLQPLMQLIQQVVDGESMSDDFTVELREYSRKLKVHKLVGNLQEAIADSRDGVRHVSRIVRAMKEFAHPGQEEKIPVELNHALESTIAVATNEWKYVAELETDFDESNPTVTGHAGELNQVFLNILVNAAHAIGDATDGGAAGKGTICVATKMLDDCAEVTISDSGNGIPDEVREKIFDPFFTTKEIGKGTGQGLAIAHSVVVNQHDGRLWCESSPETGTTFYIRLPFDQVEAKQPTEEPVVSAL